MRAVIADEWAVLRNGVTAVLNEDGVGVTARVSTASEGLAELAERTTQLFVIGLVHDLTAIHAVERARQVAEDTAVAVLLAEPSRDMLVGLLDAGAGAVLPRMASEKELRSAVSHLRDGERFVSPGLLAMVFGPETLAHSSSDSLTPRERRVLALLVEGRSNREIASELFIGESTVKTHLRNVYEKLGVANRIQAVNRAIELRMLF